MVEWWSATFVAYTYDQPTSMVTVYHDGRVANIEAGTTLNTHAVDATAAANQLPFRVGAQTEANGTVTPALMGSMTIARVRVYDEALPATGADSIDAHYRAEVGFFDRPRLSIQFDGGAGTATIMWNAVPGSSYTVETSSDLAAWTSRATGLTTGAFVDFQAGTAPRRFYRIFVE